MEIEIPITRRFTTEQTNRASVSFIDADISYKDIAIINHTDMPLEVVVTGNVAATSWSFNMQKLLTTKKPNELGATILHKPTSNKNKLEVNIQIKVAEEIICKYLDKEENKDDVYAIAKVDSQFCIEPARVTFYGDDTEDSEERI
jgi:hypothetical protein